MAASVSKNIIIYQNAPLLKQNINVSIQFFQQFYDSLSLRPISCETILILCLKCKSKMSWFIFVFYHRFLLLFLLLSLLLFIVLLVPVEVKLYHSVLFLSRLIIHGVLQPNLVVLGFQIGELLLILSFPLPVFFLFRWFFLRLIFPFLPVLRSLRLHLSFFGRLWLFGTDRVGFTSQSESDLGHHPYNPSDQHQVNHELQVHFKFPFEIFFSTEVVMLAEEERVHGDQAQGGDDLADQDQHRLVIVQHQFEQDHDQHSRELDAREQPQLQLPSVVKEGMHAPFQEGPQPIADDHQDVGGLEAVHVVDEVSGHLAVDPVVEKVAGGRAEQDDEHEQNDKGIDGLACQAEAEENVEGSPAKEREEFQVALDQNFHQNQPEGVNPEELGDFVVEQEVEHSVEQEDHHEVERDREGQEVQDRAEEEVVLPRLLCVLGVGVGVILLGDFDAAFDGVQPPSQPDHFPLVLLQEADRREDLTREAVVALPVVVVEPQVLQGQEDHFEPPLLHHSHEGHGVLQGGQGHVLYHALSSCIHGIQLRALDAFLRLVAALAAPVAVFLAHSPFVCLLVHAVVGRLDALAPVEGVAFAAGGAVVREYTGAAFGWARVVVDEGVHS